MLPNNAQPVLSQPDEAAQFFNTLGGLTGIEVNALNYRAVLSEAAKSPLPWGTDPDAPAAVLPPGNLTNDRNDWPPSPFSGQPLSPWPQQGGS